MILYQLNQLWQGAGHLAWFTVFASLGAALVVGILMWKHIKHHTGLILELKQIQVVLFSGSFWMGYWLYLILLMNVPYIWPLFFLGMVLLVLICYQFLMDAVGMKLGIITRVPRAGLRG